MNKIISERNTYLWFAFKTTFGSNTAERSFVTAFSSSFLSTVEVLKLLDSMEPSDLLFPPTPGEDFNLQKNEKPYIKNYPFLLLLPFPSVNDDKII